MFFFFKQKTAYEMRISDWSSDVCSSDLSNFWWGAEHGHEMEGQDNWYIDTDYGPTQSIDPFSVDDGVLTITAAVTPQNLLSEVEGKPYTSGLLTTRDSFAQSYGYLEIRADMPEGQGRWPADRASGVEGKGGAEA